VKIRKLNRRDRVEFVLDYYAGGKRVRKWFRNKAAAEGEVSTLKEQTRVCGVAWTDISPSERSDLMFVVEEARKENLTLRQIWSAYKRGELDTTPMLRRTLREAIRETIDAKRAENLRERYLDGLEVYLHKFAGGRTETFVDRFTVADIEQWFDLRKEALSTRRSNLGRLGSLFDLCWRRGYAKENVCLRVATPKIDHKPPVILTPKQAQAMLTTCRKEHRQILPWLVLGLFCGIRPEELTKLTWADVDLKAGTVRVDAAASKVRRRRIVGMHKTAIAWLKACRPDKGGRPIVSSVTTLRRHRRKLRDALKLEWEQDLLRHTAASYLLALHKDPNKVATMLGNSARILEQHYKELVTAKDCEAFWNLSPSTL